MSATAASAEHADWTVDLIAMLDRTGDQAAARGLIEQLGSAKQVASIYRVRPLLEWARGSMSSGLAPVAVEEASSISQANPHPVEEVEGFAEIAATYEYAGSRDKAAWFVSRAVDAAVTTRNVHLRIEALEKITVAYIGAGLKFTQRIATLLQRLISAEW